MLSPGWPRRPWAPAEAWIRCPAARRLSGEVRRGGNCLPRPGHWRRPPTGSPPLWAGIPWTSTPARGSRLACLRLYSRNSPGAAGKRSLGARRKAAQPGVLRHSRLFPPSSSVTSSAAGREVESSTFPWCSAARPRSLPVASYRGVEGGRGGHGGLRQVGGGGR